MSSDNHYPPLLFRFSTFLSNPLELPTVFVNNAHTVWLNLLQIISKDYFCSVWLITEGDYMYASRNSGKNENEVLNAVQQMKPTTLTLNCPKLLQNIEIRISCDKCVFTPKIL